MEEVPPPYAGKDGASDTYVDLNKLRSRNLHMIRGVSL